MKFRIRSDRGFNSGGKVYTDKVVARKFNGYIVEHDGEEYFLWFNDIEVIDISDTEKALPIRF